MGSDYKIRISCNANYDICDYSDENFSINRSTNPITVTSPNGGEILEVGASHNITWDYPGEGCSTDVRISLYKGGGKQYEIAPNLPAGSGTYNWTIPASQAVGSDYKIRVSCNANYDICDYSDENFSISVAIA